MSDARGETAPDEGRASEYDVTEQIGHLLRRAHQRATAVFQETLDDPGMTPMQLAALMRLVDAGPVSQNRLGRETAMDPATIQGVIRRLEERGLIERRPDPSDRRRTLLSASEAGGRLAQALIPSAEKVSARTLDPLSESERRALIALLKKIA
ncbi:MAG: MarR family winged helix-turn-helix transcriptional regulator [Marivibrio sp.]|uniref:MarR family winged helix-turn-helix transcriptional regulator n=1 Tax=Marivibrio sp. TaxID=2039719 RepID=UPI0032EF86CD